MGDGLIALFFAGGAGAWIYTKLMRNTGGNTRSALIASALISALLFVVLFFALSTLF